MAFPCADAGATGLDRDDLTPEVAYRLQGSPITHESPWLRSDQVVVMEGKLIVPEGRSGEILARINLLATQHLPPEHRESIAERLGCADLPDWMWHRVDLHFRECDVDPSRCREVAYRCPCWTDEEWERGSGDDDGDDDGRISGVKLTPHPIAAAPGLVYFAGWCGADGHGCGKVWWSRQDGNYCVRRRGKITRETRWGGPPLAPTSTQSRVIENENFRAHTRPDLLWWMRRDG